MTHDDAQGQIKFVVDEPIFTDRLELLEQGSDFRSLCIPSSPRGVF